MHAGKLEEADRRLPRISIARSPDSAAGLLQPRPGPQAEGRLRGGRERAAPRHRPRPDAARGALHAGRGALADRTAGRGRRGVPRGDRATARLRRRALHARARCCSSRATRTEALAAFREAVRDRSRLRRGAPEPGPGCCRRQGEAEAASAALREAERLRQQKADARPPRSRSTWASAASRAGDVAGAIAELPRGRAASHPEDAAGALPARARARRAGREGGGAAPPRRGPPPRALPDARTGGPVSRPPAQRPSSRSRPLSRLSSRRSPRRAIRRARAGLRVPGRGAPRRACTPSPSSAAARQNKYLLETTGCGVAFFDYDGDGWLDVFLVNGTTLEGFPKGQEPTQPPLPQPRRRHVRGRDRARGPAPRPAGARASAPATTTTTAARTCSSPTTARTASTATGRRRRFEDVTAEAGLDERAHALGNGLRVPRLRPRRPARPLRRELHRPRPRRPRPRPTRACAATRACTVACGPPGLPGRQERALPQPRRRHASRTSRSAPGILTARGTYGLGVSTLDFDDDGWTDLYVANDSNPSALYRNNRDGTFDGRGGPRRAAPTARTASRRPAWASRSATTTATARMDIFKTNFAGRHLDALREHRRRASARTAPSRAASASTRAGWAGAPAFVDLDNDGWLDLFLVNGHVYPEVEQLKTEAGYEQRKVVYRNLGDGRFEDVTERLGPPATDAEGRAAAPRSATSTTTATWTSWSTTSTTRPDLFRLDAEPAQPLAAAEARRARARTAAPSARACAACAGGAEQVEEVRGGGSYISQNDLRVHFGLGAAARVDRLEVRWPNGLEEDWRELSGGPDPDRSRKATGAAGRRAAAMTTRGSGRCCCCWPRLQAPRRNAPDLARPRRSPRRAPSSTRATGRGGHRQAAARSTPKDDPRVRLPAGRRALPRRRPRAGDRALAPAAAGLPRARSSGARPSQVLGLSPLPGRALRGGDPATSSRRETWAPDNARAGLRARHGLHPDAAAGARRARPGPAASASPPTRAAAHLLDRADDGPRASSTTLAEAELKQALAEGPAPAPRALPARPDRALPRAGSTRRVALLQEGARGEPRPTPWPSTAWATRHLASSSGTTRSRRCSARSGSTRTSAGPTSCSAGPTCRRATPRPPRACCARRSHYDPEQQGRPLPAGPAAAAGWAATEEARRELELAERAAGQPPSVEAGAPPSSRAAAVLAAGLGRLAVGSSRPPRPARWPVTLVDVAAQRRASRHPSRLRRARAEALHHRDQRRGRRLPRLRQRRLAGRARAERHAPARRARAKDAALAARPGARPTASTATTRDGTFEDVTDARGPAPHRLGLVGLRRATTTTTAGWTSS